MQKHLDLIQDFLLVESKKEHSLKTKYRGPCHMLLDKGKLFEHLPGPSFAFDPVYHNHCFKTSHKVAKGNPAYTYFEGYVFDGRKKTKKSNFKKYHFIRHGWLYHDSIKEIVDMTYKGHYGEAYYLGIPIPIKVAQKLVDASGYFGLFWGPNKLWSRIEKVLLKHKVI